MALFDGIGINIDILNFNLWWQLSKNWGRLESSILEPPGSQNE